LYLLFLAIPLDQHLSSVQNLFQLKKNCAKTARVRRRDFGRGWGLVCGREKIPDPEVFFQIKPDGSKVPFKPGEVIHIKEPDIKQNIFGIP